MIRLALLIACLATPAASQGNCWPRSTALSVLTGPDWRESVYVTNERSIGLVELFVNPDTGTWSFTLTRNGITCILEAGEGYHGPLGEPT
ncbi:MAG: hypothetical protein ACPG4X_22795 [Pikeienuella sp.]